MPSGRGVLLPLPGPQTLYGGNEASTFRKVNRMDFFTVFGLNAITIGVCLFLLWLVSLGMRDASIIDIFWGLGFVIIAWVSLATASQPSLRTWIVTGLTTLWGLRLASYLAWRNLGHGEDRRYQEMRQHHGSWFPLVSLFTVFAVQGLIMLLVSVPLQVTAASSAGLSYLDYLGLAIWTVGWLFESVGDWQMARFQANPDNAGQVMDRGLWRYTRHPNYFGDFLVWWGFFLFALGADFAWWTVVSPLLMSLLLLRVSGVTLLERSIKKRRPGYEEYVRRTSAFFPWWPRTP